MVKGKPWTPSTLRAVGGTRGVGVTFLEETFSPTTAPPEHRLHQKAARTVLKALLPENRTDIKGQMRSHEELLAASGYSAHPQEFAELIQILDGELRLITPTDPAGIDPEDVSRPTAQENTISSPTTTSSITSANGSLASSEKRVEGALSSGVRSRLRSGRPRPRTVSCPPHGNGARYAV